MAKKKQHKAGWQNVLSNISKRLERAKRKGKSEAYIKDLQKSLEKHH